MEQSSTRLCITFWSSSTEMEPFLSMSKTEKASLRLRKTSSESMSCVLSSMNSRRSMKPLSSPSTSQIIAFSSSSVATWLRLPMMDPSSDHEILSSPLTSNLLNTCCGCGSSSKRSGTSYWTWGSVVMAFCNKLGGLVRRSVSTNNASTAQVPMASMFNALRCMSTKLFIGGLSYGTDDCSLKEAFSSFGEVVEARVITDRDSGRSRGFGFVNFTEAESANEALSAMDGQQLQGRNIRVSYAQERSGSGPREGGFGGSRSGSREGGFGGGRQIAQSGTGSPSEDESPLEEVLAAVTSEENPKEKVSCDAPNATLLDKVRTGLDHDPVARQIKQAAIEGKTKKFWIEDGLLVTTGRRVYVPKWKELRRKIMQECHDSRWAGHPGQKRTQALIERTYYCS
nr:glycine-rich RNA-binding protein 2, mitochondrial-like [Ipomoea batatas]